MQIVPEDPAVGDAPGCWVPDESGALRYESTVPGPGVGMVLFEEPALNVGGLGPRWEQVEAALADIQADLSRTVPDAPQLVLLWRDDGGHRQAYVGKSREWHSGTEGFELRRSCIAALVDIVYDVKDVINDNLLEDRWVWPLCPDDGWELAIAVDNQQRCDWVCNHEHHPVAEVGQLRQS